MATVPCPSCGWGVAVDARQCPRCGAQVSAARLLVTHRPGLAAIILLVCFGYLAWCYWSCTGGW